jgi:hypothetical protein
VGLFLFLILYPPAPPPTHLCHTQLCRAPSLSPLA